MNCVCGCGDPVMEAPLSEATPTLTYPILSLNAQLPVETMIPHFRRLIGGKDLAPMILDRKRVFLPREGLQLEHAAIIAPPTLTNCASDEPGPEMHQTKKEEQWHVGMKAHIGVDADSNLVHAVKSKSANEADFDQIAEFLQGKGKSTVGDLGCNGAHQRYPSRLIMALKHSRKTAALEVSQRRNANIPCPSRRSVPVDQVPGRAREEHCSRGVVVRAAEPLDGARR